MAANSIINIEITKKIDFFGDGDTLETRLRNVSLRGFDSVKIYEPATIKSIHLSPAAIRETLYSPQPHLHQDYLNKVMHLAELFEQKGINIFQLDHAYDYNAYDDSGEVTEWTMLPPIVEKMIIPRHERGGFDYAPLIGDSLQQSLTEHGWRINPETEKMSYSNDTDTFLLINDGSHRVHAGLESANGITILEMSDMTKGYPYYAAPQPYALVEVFEKRDESKDLKVHVIDTPGQKQLYRLFPSGGIHSGSVRPQRENETFI